MINTFKVIVAGGREFDDYVALDKYLTHLFKDKKNVEIVSGKARGADTLGEKYALNHLLILKEFPADWETFGKSAGIKRNIQMGDYADALVAFWDGKSRGTKQMIDYATKKGLHVRVYRYE